MHDIRAIRDNPAEFDRKLGLRGLEPLAERLIALDEQRRSVIGALQEMQNRRNAASKEIGKAKGSGDEAGAQALMAEMTRLKDEIPATEEEERRLVAALDSALMAIPNLPDDEVPVGADEDANVVLRRVGDIRNYDFEPKQHFDIGEAMGLLDFEAARKLSGARFAVLRGELARLERAIAAFMLDLHTGEFGYTEVIPPFLVRSEIMAGTAQLPKFENDQFSAAKGNWTKPTDDGGADPADLFWLIPTAEVPLTNLVREDILDEEALPLRFTAYTPCFRAEAGSAGRDTRGLIRLHQFSKVELVSVTMPEQSVEEHERMTACAEEVLRRLGLPYRVVVLSTGDMGFGASKTYDIEVWLPGQNAYREISSCSNCRDFQARRMNARCRPKGEKKRTRFVNTLNGSGLAVGRTLVAILENYQQADGTVAVPEALQPYLNGRTVIGG